MKNNFITKIIGATLAFAMMIGGAVGINIAKEAKPVNADEESAYTIIFGNNAGSANGISSTTNATTAISSGTEYVVSKPFTVGSGNVYYGDTKTCIRLGKSGNNASLSIALSDSGKVKATKFIVNCARYAGNKNAGATLSVNGMDEQSVLEEAGNLTFTYGTETDITSIQLSSVKAVYIYSIQVFKYKISDDPAKTVQANSVAIKSGSTTISGTFEPNSSYYLGDTLDLTNSEVTYQQGDTYQNGLGAINWNSSNTNVATITSNGIVTFVGRGTSIITATAVDEGLNHAVISASFTLDLRNAESIPGTIYQPYTADEARSAIDSGEGITGVYASGIVSEIVTAYSSQYNNVSFNISVTGDPEENQLQAYRCGGAEAANIDIGDTVVITGNLKKYNSTYEFDQGCSIVTRTPAQYSVVYNANGATSGAVPVDNTQYGRNAQVTLATNTGNLQKEGYTFNGWNTKTDPTINGAVHYNAGAQIQITSNLTLYAEWLSLAPSITVQANLSGYTGQSADLDFSYGNIANESNLSVVAADSKVTVGDLIADGGVGAVTITFNTAGETSLSFRNNGEELAICAVVVNQSEISITGLSPRGKVQIGATLNLGNQVTINHSGIYSGDVVWESSDTDVATVNDSGVVTGKAIGQTTITVTSFDKLDVYQSCVVNVYKGPICNTLDLSIASYVSASDELVKWSCDYAELTNAVGSGTTKPNNYLGGTNASSRMYKNNIMTITPNAGYVISSVEFTATTNNFATALKNSAWTNATAVSDNTLVTVTPTDGSVAFGATIGANCGFTTVKIYIAPNSLLNTSSVIKTISGVESNEGATVTNVALRFGGVIPVSTWNQINSNWAVTDFGVMFARGSMLTARSLDSLEKVFRNNPADVAMVHRGSVGTPNANGDDYIFTARLNLEEADYDEVFYAAPFIVAGGEYYFLQEMHYSVRTLAEECLTSGESTLSQAALTTLKGNN